MSGKKKAPTDVVKKLETSISSVPTLPEGPYKAVETKKTGRRFARENK